MDVKINCNEGKFKYRVCGLIINEDKLLTVNIQNNGFYCLPGGHVHLGEDTFEAIKREIKEEIGVVAEEINLMSVMENFFIDKSGLPFHEVGFYYIIKSSNLGDKSKDFTLIENDEGELKRLEFKWIALDDIEEANFRPYILKEKLKKRDFSFSHLVLHEDR